MNDQPKPQDQPQVTQQQASPLVAQPNNGQTSQPATAQQLQQAETNIEDRMSAFERSMVRLTRAGVFVACITLLVFLGQLYEMRDAGQQTRNLVTAANQQVAAAQGFEKSASAIQTTIGEVQGNMQTIASSSASSIQATQNALRLEQRAWITIQSEALKSLQANQPARVEIEILNTGKTIAPEGEASGFIYFPTEYLKDFSPIRNVKPKSTGVIFVNSPIFIPLFTDLPVTANEVTEVMSGKRFLFIWGDIRYKDVFKTLHHTNFCGVYVPISHRFAHCEGYKYHAN